jgi:hypothetical protein
MGATIATLDHIQWNPVSPVTWLDRQGDRWEYQPGTSAKPILDDIKTDIEADLWRKAAQHRNGAGLQEGVDMTVIKKHLKYFKKKELNAEAGLLTLVAAGGLWPKERKFGTQPPMVDNPFCPDCTGEVQDDFHLFWGCPALGLSKEKEIIKTQRLQHKALDHRHSQPCFWTRGMVPKAWTERPPIPAEEIHDINVLDPEQRFKPNGETYLDGSGGECSSDPRLRACGWAWAQKRLHDLTLEPHLNAIGMYGSL